MHFSYTELLWLLLVYSFLGWVIETAVSAVKTRKFSNRGFSTGPYCLIYGITAVILTVTMGELLDNTLFLLIGCGTISTAAEWFTGKLLERMNRHKWWDYSGKKWNFDGYICLQYTVFWAILGVIMLRFTNPVLSHLFRSMPSLIRNILLGVLTAGVLLDMAASVAASQHIRKDTHKPAAEIQHPAACLRKFFRTIFSYVEKRMAKAYPILLEKTEEIRREGKFAEGCGFYKLFWLFLIGSALGDAFETVFCRITAGVWMNRSSLVWGRFSVVWGIAMAAATALLHKDIDKPTRHIFLVGTLLGGTYEYVLSVLSELVFGQIFWDYSHIPFNLGGRINLLFCLFWGVAAVIWIKVLYPKLSALIEKIPRLPGYLLTWTLVVFMSANCLVSGLALIRYNVRAGGPAAESGWERMIDTHFDDERMKELYPNSKFR